LPILASVRTVLDGYNIEAPKKLKVKDSDFVDRVLLPAAPVFGQLADVASTAVAMNHGFVEGNPAVKALSKNLPLFAAVKVAVGVATAVAVHKIENKGHKRIASALGTLAGLLPAASNTIKLIRE